MLLKLSVTLCLISILNAQLPPSDNYIEGAPAMGFQYDSGASWAVLCTGTPYGTIPGKLDGNGGAYFPWGGKENRCSSFEIVWGTLYPNGSALPADCAAKGFQTNDNAAYYNAVINGAHGWVPGKANAAATYAWYPWGGKEHGTKSNFYVIC